MSDKSQGSLAIDKPDERLVTINIGKTQNDNSDVYLCVKSRHMLIKRGVDAKVPKYMVDSIAELQTIHFNEVTKEHEYAPKYSISYKQ